MLRSWLKSGSGHFFGAIASELAKIFLAVAFGIILWACEQCGLPDTEKNYFAVILLFAAIGAINAAEKGTDESPLFLGLRGAKTVAVFAFLGTVGLAIVGFALNYCRQSDNASPGYLCGLSLIALGLAAVLHVAQKFCPPKTKVISEMPTSNDLFDICLAADDSREPLRDKIASIASQTGAKPSDVFMCFRTIRFE